MVDYTDTIEVHGLRVPFVSKIITPKIEKPLRRGRYGKGEVDLLLSVLKPGDRLLDLGGGLGVVAAAVSQAQDNLEILSVEADRRLTRLIREVWRLNGIKGANLIQAAVLNQTAAAQDPIAPFYVRPNFWSSSAAPDERPHDSVAEVPAVALGELLTDQRPTVLFCDIEGGELDLWEGADLSCLRHIVLKLHPEVYGQDGLRTLVDRLAEHGFLPNTEATPEGALRQFDRIPTGAENGAERSIEETMPRRRYRAESTKDSSPLRIFLPTCMKNEGPFILEWLAWHRAVGVTDFVVFTNGCTDGTDQLLDHLASRGLLRHMPNPALAVTATNFQPLALHYAHFLPEFEAADYVLSMDVDEFVNVRVGDGTLAALIEAAGEFDVLSISELNHGCNGQNRYREGHLTELFPGHQTETPGNKRAQRGVKSLVRMSPRVRRIRNHRPDMDPSLGSVLWRDGSAQLRHELMQDPGDNGWDCRGTYDLVSLDHFPLRSLESFLVKMHRGDVVVANKKASNRYWRTRNFSEASNSDLTVMRDRMQVEYDALLSAPETRRLHEACVDAHRARIAALSDEPEYLERKAWIYNEAWRDAYPEEAAHFMWETTPAPQDD